MGFATNAENFESDDNSEDKREEKRTSTTIRAQCPDCGDIRLTENDVTVRICSDNDVASCWFICAECDKPVAKPLAPHIAELLLASGAHLEMYRLPAELREHEQQSDTEPLTLDDLLDFHVEIKDFDFLAKKVMSDHPNSVADIDLTSAGEDQSHHHDHDHSSDADPHQL